MPDKTTPFFELRDALLAGGCPLCRLGNRAASRYIESALYEGMTNPPLRLRLRAAQGFCRRHAWEMTRMRASVLGTAIVYRDVVNDLIAALEDPAAAPAGFLRRREPQPLPTPELPCPACAVGDEEAGRAGEVLRQHLDDAEIAAAYRRSGGLCLPHLRDQLARARGRQGATLRAWQLAAYQDLRGQLDELIRKHDYRFQDEPMGEEGGAWLAAVARIV
ncbi:MAG TPA: DUF6062 family protein, partial [Anaerolineae bacterium]